MQFAAALVIATLSCGTALAGLSTADQATLAKHTLTVDELNRLTATLKAAKAHGTPAAVDLTRVSSIDAVAARVDSQPGSHALLAAHGFTSRDYVIVSLTIARASIMAQMGTGAGNPNVAFYRAHQAQIDKTMDFGPSSEPAAGSSPDLTALKGDKLRECTKVSMGTVALVPLSLRGTANSPPESRLQIADALDKMVPKVSEQNLQDDFRDISAEIRRQAAAPQFSPTPRSTQALDDLKSWLQTNCVDKKVQTH